MITMSSYNSFKHNCLRDAIMINIVSFFTSIYAGFAVFSIIGYMASEYNVEVDQIIDSGSNPRAHESLLMQSFLEYSECRIHVLAYLYLHVPYPLL